jgi:hypothetical protein
MSTPARTRDEHGQVIYDPLQAAVAKADDAVLHHRLYELDDAIEGPTPEEERDAIREEIERRDADKLRRQQEFEARRAAAREKFDGLSETALEKVLDAAEAVFASEDAYAETEGTGTPPEGQAEGRLRLARRRRREGNEGV